jgi:SSS family solute:Na+ symporter
MPNVLHLRVHPYWVGTLVIWVMIILAVLLAWAQRVPPEQRTGLTLIGPASRTAARAASAQK